MSNEQEMMQSVQQNRRNRGQNRRNANAQRNLVRASEVVSPAPAGHFLRQFGESDREIIENSNTEASVPQALSLLNGLPLNLVLNQTAPLTKAVQGASDSEGREDALFLSFLGRTPSERERELMRGQIEIYGPRQGYRLTVGALLNTQEFRFVQ